MNTKQLTGFIALSIGVVILIFAVQGEEYLPEHPVSVENLPNRLLKSTEVLPLAPNLKEMDRGNHFWLAVGFTLVLVGGVIVVRYRR